MVQFSHVKYPDKTTPNVTEFFVAVLTYFLHTHVVRLQWTLVGMTKHNRDKFFAAFYKIHHQIRTTLMGLLCFGVHADWMWRRLDLVTEFPLTTLSVLPARRNTLLCHYTVCIHIDFPSHHYPLWSNVNNAWRSQITRSVFACLLLSVTHSYLTCNFLWRTIVLQITIIHFHLPAVFPRDAESKSHSTFDTVNKHKVLECGVERALDISITPSDIQKCGILATQHFSDCAIL